MSAKQALSDVYRHDPSRYSGQKEVSRMVDSPCGCAFLPGRARSVLIAVLLTLLVGLPLAVCAQEEPFLQRVSGALIHLPEGYLPALIHLMEILEEDEEARTGLLELPREFLVDQELVPSIELASDEFQITVLDFAPLPEEMEVPWFSAAEPLDELGFDLKGVGVFYGAVGIFIQEAIEIEEPPLEGAPEPILEKQTEDLFRFISERLAGDTLERLREVMKELDRMDVEDPQRIAFLENAREYLLEHELTLPASRYRIVALDFERAAELGAIHAAEIRAGLAVVPEGIGVFNRAIGVFLQQAI